MATNRWIGLDQKQSQINTITPANVGIGNTFTVTINSKSYTFTATAGTVANVTAGLQALLAASTEGEFREITWTDQTTYLQGAISDAYAGTPFTQTSSATGGTATNTTATATANISPSDINNADNWSDGVPNASDDVVIDAGEVGLLWNLGSLSAVTLTSFTRRRTHTGAIGLPERNSTGTYWEYRATELAISATTMTIEQGQSDQPASLKFNVGSVQTALTVLGEGGGSIGSEVMWWRGTHASNVVNVLGGSLAIGCYNLNAATVATLRAENAVVRCGSAVSLTTVTNLNSTMEINSNVTTFTQNGDSAETRFKGTAAVTTLRNYGGKVVIQSSGTITTYTPGPDSEIDFSEGSGPVTITNAVTFPAGAKFRDPEGRVTLSNGYVLGSGVRIEDVELDFGPGRTFTVA